MDHNIYFNPSMPAEHEFIAREFEDDENFDYKLIKKVEIFTFLYNNQRKKPEKVSAAWKKISASLGKTDECQKRWLRLRQYYSKERQRRESGVSSYKWPLYDAMAFLIPFIKKKRTGSQKQKVSASPPVVKSQESSVANTKSNLESRSMNSDEFDGFDGFEDVEYDFNVEQIVEEQTLPTTTSPGTNIASATTVVPDDTVASAAATVPRAFSPIGNFPDDTVVPKSPAHKDNSDVPESPSNSPNLSINSLSTS
ncbi:uncharacterized protein LOC107981832 [Nasonia vitripennis]|uniref:MADF domain-containing protein n=1 Tax=Nasonia vitripennis TaxID=7425 RepID=A0A7M7TA74_NASVI|nr:uncharacterized protein LOC107981832 [Nasonia vitripennis]